MNGRNNPFGFSQPLYPTLQLDDWNDLQQPGFRLNSASSVGSALSGLMLPQRNQQPAEKLKTLIKEIPKSFGKPEFSSAFERLLVTLDQTYSTLIKSGKTPELHSLNASLDAMAKAMSEIRVEQVNSLHLKALEKLAIKFEQILKLFPGKQSQTWFNLTMSTLEVSGKIKTYLKLLEANIQKSSKPPQLPPFPESKQHESKYMKMDGPTIGRASAYALALSIALNTERQENKPKPKHRDLSRLLNKKKQENKPEHPDLPHFLNNPRMLEAKGSATKRKRKLSLDSEAPLGKNRYRGILGDEEIDFQVNTIDGDQTDCGFLALKTSRAELADTLLAYENSAKMRIALAPEIEEFLSNRDGLHFLDGKIPGRHYQALLFMKNLIAKAMLKELDEETRRKYQEAAREELLTKEVYVAYVNAYKINEFGYKLMLGYEAAKLYTKLKMLTPVRLYLWKEKEGEPNKIACIKQPEDQKEGESLNLIHTRQGTHYDVLMPVGRRKIALPQKKEKTSEELSSSGALSLLVASKMDASDDNPSSGSYSPKLFKPSLVEGGVAEIAKNENMKNSTLSPAKNKLHQGPRIKNGTNITQ